MTEKKTVTHREFRRVTRDVQALRYDGEENTREYLFKWSQGLVRPTSVDGFPIVLQTFAGVASVEVGDYVVLRNGLWTVQTAADFEGEHYGSSGPNDAPSIWPTFERMQGEIAREIRNMLGEPAYDQKLFTQEQLDRRVESMKLVAADSGDEVSRHEAWIAQHIAAGWQYGPNFDPIKKEHPNLVPFNELPETTKSKVRIFDIVAKYAQAIIDGNFDYRTEYKSEGL